jgi:hypothetical protein
MAKRTCIIPHSQHVSRHPRRLTLKVLLMPKRSDFGSVLLIRGRYLTLAIWTAFTPLLAVIILCFALFTPTKTHAADLGCETNPNLTGPCSLVHGTIMPTADIGLVLATGQQSRAIVLAPAPGSTHALSRELDRLDADWLRTTITGDFVICPIPELKNQFGPGFLKYACVVSGTHLVTNSSMH